MTKRLRKDRQSSHYRRALKFGVKIEPVRYSFVVQRDNSTCYMCQRILMPHQVQFDHIVPLSRGGEHSEKNLRVACAICNNRKGNKLPVECKWLNKPTGILILKKC